MVTLTTTRKHTVKQARQILGITKKQLCDQTGLSMNAVNAIEDGGEYRTQIGVALLIAEALGLEVCEIDWPRGLSHLGRPPLTGTVMTRTTTITISETVVERSLVCPLCRFILPLTKVCDTCG